MRNAQRRQSFNAYGYDMHTTSRLVLRVVPSVAVVRVVLVPVDVPVDMIMGVIRNHVVARSALPSRRWYLSRLLELRFVRQVHTGRRLEAQGREQPVENKRSVTVRQHAILPSCRFAVSRRTHTSIANPATCRSEKGHTSRSHPTIRLTIQIPSVLHVSMVLLVVALTRLVTLRPK